MFDDPKRRLYELDEALKAAYAEEMEQEEEPDWLQDVKDLLNESATEVMPISRKENAARHAPEPARNPSRKPEKADFSRMTYADEQMRETDALFVEKPQRKGAGSLVILALLELLGIGLVVLWWLKWML